MSTELVLYNNKDDEKKKHLEIQRKKVERINAYFLQNPSLAFALVSGYVSLCGFAILWIVFYKEKVNLIDYVSIGDFFFGVFAVDFALPLIFLVVVFLFWGYFRLSKVYWAKINRFWVFVITYLVFAPIFPAYYFYKPVLLCHPDNKLYSVTYKLPSMKVESDLFMVASLSNYKVFKRSAPGCDVNYGDYSDGDFNKDFELVVIHDSAIAKIESITNKT